MKNPKHCSSVGKIPRTRMRHCRMTEYCTVCFLWICFFFHHGPTLCATIKLCLTTLETQQITNSTLLNPTLWLPRKSVNPSRWNGPQKGHSPTSCTDMCQYPIHSRLLQVLASWISQTSGDRDYTAFLGSLFHCLHDGSGKGTFQKWTGMRNEWLTFKSGYCSEQFVGFSPLGGTKTHLLCYTYTSQNDTCW